MGIIKILGNIFSKCAAVFSALLIYRNIYQLIGIFKTRKFGKAKKNHTYAIMIAARNEEAVIGNLIDSIKGQDYDMSLVKIFVVADNCTDKTAHIAKLKGATVYERFDDVHKTKGYALQYLVECINRDFGTQSFEGFFVFDADNLLKSDYITRMNESFDAGEKIITSYRHSKNIGDNWISASYAVHWLRTVRNEHRARSLLHLATRIQGTGFLFASEIIKDGWRYVNLTEDRAFCADAVVNGYKISYNHDAIFYDEQPTNLKIAMRQRIRWAKGHIQSFFESGPKLFLHIFYTGGLANKDKSESKTRRLLRNIRLRFMSFDMLIVFIAGSASFKLGLIPYLLNKIFDLFGITSVGKPFYIALAIGLATLLAGIADSYLKGIITATYVYIIEARRIKKISLIKKIWFIFTFPIFDLMGKLALIIALFTRVEWKPIPHNADIKIGDIEDTSGVASKEGYTPEN